MAQGRRLPPDQDQQGQKCSPGSAGPKGRTRPTRAQLGVRGKSGSPEGPEPRLGIDTLVICRRVLEDVPIKLGRGWVADARRNPITYSWEEWHEYDAIETQGWLARWNDERRVLEIRLTVPMVMVEGVRRNVTNYPLMPFRMQGLEEIGPSIARALGVRWGDRDRVIKWAEFGVRRLDVAADIPVPDIGALIRTLNQMAHAGKWRGYDTTAHWRTGTKATNFYAKRPELLSKIGQASLEQVERWHGPLDDVVRFEVSLGATDIKATFGLTDTKWLPKLGAAVKDNAIKWILHDEVYRKLRLQRLAARKRSRADWACSLASDIVSQAKKEGEALGTTKLATLVGVYLLLAGFKSTRVVSERLDLPRSTVNKYRRELEVRGFPPNVGYEPYARRCIGDFLKPFLALIATPPRKPVLRRATRDLHTISAPWLVEPDITRPVEGLAVDGSEDDEIAELLEAAGIG